VEAVREAFRQTREIAEILESFTLSLSRQSLGDGGSLPPQAALEAEVETAASAPFLGTLFPILLRVLRILAASHPSQARRFQPIRVVRAFRGLQLSSC
jgi:hypothetical protein